MKIKIVNQKTIGTVLGTLTAPVTNILIVFLVARYINHEVYGQYILVLTLIQAVGFILYSGLGNSMTRFINDIEPRFFHKHFGYFYMMLFPLMVITLLLIMNLVYVDRFSWFVQLIIIIMSFLIPTINFEISVLNFKLNYLSFGLFKLLYAIMFHLLPIITYMLFDLDDYTVFLYSLFVGLIIVFLALVRKKETIFSNFNLQNKNFHKGIMSYSIIVTVSSVASWAISFSDRVMIESIIDSSTLTIYVLNAQIAGVVGIVLSLVSVYFFPNIYKNFKHNPILELKKALTVQAILILVIVLFSFLYFYIGDDLLLFVLEKSYDVNSFWLVYILLIANSLLIFINYSSVFLSLLDKIHINTYAYLIGAIINIFINIVFLRDYGVLVAAVSTLVAYSIILLITNTYLLLNFKSLSIYQLKEEGQI